MIKGIIEKGLIYHLDGIQNRGSSKKHRNDAPTWVNLANEEQYCDIKGDPQWDDKGLTFSGTSASEYVTLGEFNPGVITIECIIRICNDSTESTIISNFCNGGYKIWEYNKTIFFGAFLENNPNFINVSTERGQLGDLNFVSCTYDGFTFKIYINGELKSSYSFYQSPISKPSDNTITIIGGIPKGQSSQSQPFNGEIHSVRMYNRALSEEEIKQNYEIDIQRYPRLERSFTWAISSSSYYRDVSSGARIPKQGGGNSTLSHINNGSFLIGNVNQWGYTTPIICSTDINALAINAYDYYGKLLLTKKDVFCTVIDKGHLWYILDSGRYYGTYALNGDEFKWLGSIGYTQSDYQSMARKMISESTIIYTEKDDGSDDDEDIYAGGRVKYVRVRSSDGAYSNALAFIVNSSNVDFEDNRSLDEHLNEKALVSIYTDTGINLGRTPLKKEGDTELIIGENSSAIGHMIRTEGDFSLATGYETNSSGLYSHAEGQGSVSSGQFSHAEGGGTTASGKGSHSEGYLTIASGDYSHAEGMQSEAKGKYSHAEGVNTLAEGEGSLALGNSTVAKGKNSIAAGKGTIARENQFVHGTFNIEDTEGKYLEIIGNGTDDEHRSNAFAISKTGDVEFSGKVTADEFDGPAIYDFRGQQITDYIYDIETQNGNELLVTHGSGEEEVLTLTGWENIQEKIGSWSCKNGNIVNRTEKRVVNFGYINRTKYRSACIFYCQLVLFASPAEGQDTVEVDFRLEIDDFEIDPTWRPKETMRKGYHVITLMHPVRQIEPNKELVHMITVYAKTSSGSFSYDTGGIRAAFFGMGIDSGDVRWDGQVKCTDNFELQRYNITFEQDEKIHKNYEIQYKNKITEYLRLNIIDTVRFNFTQKVYDKDSSGKKTGWHYNITFADDDVVFNMDNLVIGTHGLFTDSLRNNQDGYKLPDLVAMNFRILGNNLSKYNYNPYYITTQVETDETKASTENILLQQNYSSSSSNFVIDEGRAIELSINLSQFENIDTIQVKEVI